MGSNNVWVRITNKCNSNCIFCLDKNAKDIGIILSEKNIFEKILKSFDKGKFNKLIISGGEASFDDKFFDYIAYGKKIGYQRIQTITNGIRFGNNQFLEKAINTGLNEITFSLHGHTASLHDGLTGIKGSFMSIIKSLYYLQSKYTNIVVNIDIVVNKLNIMHIPKIISLVNKFNIFEFDILQIIPFGRAWENRDKLLFDDITKYKSYFQDIWKKTKDKRVVMWANRVFPSLLEGYEYMIQNPTKFKNELLDESYDTNNYCFENKKPFHCFEKHRCESCYNQFFCNRMLEYYTQNNNIITKNTFELKADLTIDGIKNLYGATINSFKKSIQKIVLNYDKVNNIPYCIVDKNNTFDNCKLIKPKFEQYVEWFINKGFLIKSEKCNLCKYSNYCKGIHINFIRSYGFRLLNPIK